MPKTRGNGDGSVYYSESRKSWVGQITVGRSAEGKLKRKAVYGKTKTEVKEKLKAVQSEILTGSFVASSSATVGSLLKYLIDNDKALNIIGDDAFNRKMNSFKHIDASDLSGTRIQNVTEDQINLFLSTLTAYSDSVIRKDFELLKRCFNEAIHRGIIVKNPMYGMHPPKSTKPNVKVRALTIAEQQRLWDALQTKNINYSEQMKIMLLTGMRMGEINALTLDDVDIESRTVTVRRSLTRDLNERYVIGKTTKTYAGMRKVPLSAPARDVFSECLTNAKNNDENLLFWDSHKNTVISTGQVGCQFTRLLEKYEILDPKIEGKVSLHSLRHTFATRCIEAGMQAKVLQKILGHTDISITLNTYCDAFNEFQEENIALLEKYMSERLAI